MGDGQSLIGSSESMWGIGALADCTSRGQRLPLYSTNQGDLKWERNVSTVDRQAWEKLALLDIQMGAMSTRA
jgi:hypothetical protein